MRWLLCLGWLCVACNLPAAVNLRTPASYRPGFPLLIWVEVTDDTGQINKQLWDETALLTVDQLGVIISPSQIPLRNGAGSALVTLQNANQDLLLSATVQNQSATRRLNSLARTPIQSVGGLLSGTSTTWSGLVQLTNTVIVPTGHTLTIQSNTWLLIDGTASGNSAPSLIVRGQLLSLGTPPHPVTITATDPTANWGQIRHENAAPSVYQHTFISKAGRAPGEGHTSTGPALRTENSSVQLDHSAITDLTAAGVTIGKSGYSIGSNLSLDHCMIARARMGPEIASTGLLCTNSFFMELRGPDDADGIYLHSSNGKPLLITHSVFAGGDDDAIDTLDSIVTIEHSILRDWPNPNEDAKGISVFHGEVIAHRTLIANCFVGASAKSSGPPARLNLQHCTISTLEKGVSASFKANATAGNILITLTNSIVRATDALHSDFGADKLIVAFSNAPEPWPGPGNTTADPLFVNSAAGNFQLFPGSPAINAGDPSSPADPDGTRADLGVFPADKSTVNGLFVSLSLPQNGARFPFLTPIAIHANAYSSSSSVTRVEFQADSQAIGLLSNPPFTLTWTNAPIGLHTLRAIVTDVSGLTAASAPITIAVHAPFQPATNTLVALGSSWKFLDIGSDQGSQWTSLLFDDSTWPSAPAQLGYGDGDEATIISFGPTPNNKHLTYYFRKLLVLDDPAAFQNIQMRLLRDDGAIVYVNSQEAFRVSLPPGPVDFQTRATSSTDYPFDSLTLPTQLFRPGTNILAVEVHQANPTSSDVSFDLELQAALAASQNTQPFVRLISPSPNRTVGANSDVRIVAEAIDPDGSIASLQLLANNSPLHLFSAPPYEFTWLNVPQGIHFLSAIAIDATGLSSTSAVVELSASDISQAPFAIDLNPPAQSTLSMFTHLTVTFDKPVVVRADDLIVNGSPALSISGSGFGPYEFGFPQPLPGRVEVQWSAAHSLRDLEGNRLNAELPWTFFVAPQKPRLIISEIHYHPPSENVREEFIELFNPDSHPVNLNGWQLTAGAQFTFPNVTIEPGAYLAVAADLVTFTNSYPTVKNVVGSWSGILSNQGETITLRDPRGSIIDRVEYADDGDWAERRRGPLDLGHYGWIWFAEHDGLGKSLEKIHPAFPLPSGQLWRSSLIAGGTPGRPNSVASTQLAPLILQAAHSPPIPRSSLPIRISAQIADETFVRLQVRLHYRIDSLTPPPFRSLAMNDQGLDGDLAAADHIYSVTLPPAPDGAVIEYYIEATDGLGQSRSWPAPARQFDGSFAQSANALLQIDDAPYSSPQPLYKLIMTEIERIELAQIGNGCYNTLNPCESQSNAQMNGTFISIDASGTQTRYLTGIRNRGHGSRPAKPNNYRVNFRSDDRWKNVTALNLNSQRSWLQQLGAALSLKAGVAGAYSRAVQVRVNNTNLTAVNFDRTYGSYAANEVLNSDWAAAHFPNDPNGNIYRANRDILPADFNYRGPDVPAYTNTWSKLSNQSENNWSDLIAMLRIVGTNDLWSVENVRSVINLEQWLRHLAAMALLNSRETGLNTGLNDDYYMYRGLIDPRFQLIFYDLDTILGEGGGSPAENVFGATAMPAFNRLLRHPDIEPLYYRVLFDLLQSTFSQTQFDPLVDQVLGDYVPPNVRDRLKTWMNARRTYVLSILPPLPYASPPIAQLAGGPRSPTPLRTASFQVHGADLSHYRFKLDSNPFSAVFPIATPIQLSNLSDGPHQLLVIGKNSQNSWQPENTASVFEWTVNSSIPTVRLNEVLALNHGSLLHAGTQPDFIELFNEGTAPVDLSGFQLTDDPLQPAKFTFPPGSQILPGQFVLVLAAKPDGTPGLHSGFALDHDADALFLFDRASAGQSLLDSIQFGSQLPDHSIGRLNQDGRWHLGRPSPNASNNALPLADPFSVRINEWLAGGQFLSAPDFVELHNPADRPAPIGGLFLTDQPLGDPLRHPIRPHSFIAPKGFATFIAMSSSASSPLHLNFKLSADAGEIALLQNPFTQIHSAIYGPQPAGRSSGSCPDGSLAIKSFDQPTPGFSNACGSGPASLALVINEVFPQSPSDPNGPFPAWAELFNSSSETIDLSGMSFTDDPLNPRRWSFPSGTQIPPQSFLTVYFNNALPPSATNAGFSLKTSGTTLHLIASPLNGAGIISSFTAALPPPNAALGQVPDGTGQWRLTAPTLNAPNRAVPLGNPADLRINEWLAASTTEDWFELYNPSPLPVDISGFFLSDDLLQPAKFQIPPRAFIGGGTNGFLLFIADPNNASDPTHVNFKLNASGEALVLSSPSGQTIDAVGFPAQRSLISQGRFPDGASQRVDFIDTPTPGSSNRLATHADTDGDGLPDAWETAAGLDPLNPSDADADPDLDGASNRVEFLSATNPNDRNSLFAARASLSPSGQVQIHFTAAADRTYIIQFRDQLSLGAWLDLAVIAPQSSVRPVSIQDPGAFAARFYRILLKP